MQLQQKKGSQCSGLSISSLSAGRREEFPFLRHFCVQSLISQLHLHQTWKLCFPKAQGIHFQETPGLDLPSDKHANHLTKRTSIWKQWGNPIQSMRIAESLVQASRETSTQSTDPSQCGPDLACSSRLQHLWHLKSPPKKRIPLLKRNTADPKTFSDQQGPKQPIHPGEREPLLKPTSLNESHFLKPLSRASKAHGFDQTLAANIYSQPSDTEL